MRASDEDWKTSPAASRRLLPPMSRARPGGPLADLRWRRRRVLELKLAGFGYREIMERLGVTYTNVNRDLTEARAELRRAA
jgi:Sigma-70, region 4